MLEKIANFTNSFIYTRFPIILIGLAIFAILVVFVSLPGHAQSSNHIYLSQSGKARVTLDYVGSYSWTGNFGLHQPFSKLLIQDYFHKPKGTTAEIGYLNSGTELVFYLYVKNTGDTFYSTDSRHCRITQLAANKWRLNWEDSAQNSTFDDVVVVVELYLVAPVANFAATPHSGGSPLTVQFTDQSTGQITGWSWNFGEGSSSTARNPTHTYRQPRKYSVSLTVTGSGGTNTKTETNYIEVIAPPVADFSATPLTGNVPLAVQFTDKSTGQITTRAWNFGDNTTSIASNPAHTYTQPGKYTVSLTAAGPGGNDTELKTEYIEVLPPKPKVIETYPEAKQKNVPPYPVPSIYAIFDLNMDISTFTSNNMRVYTAPADEKEYISGRVYSIHRRKIVFQPDTALKPGTTYGVELLGGIRAANGQALSGYSWWFKTAPLDLTVTHIEITQAIQDTANSVPLVAGKPTAVRVYVDCGEGCRPTREVTAVLRGYRGSQLVGEIQPWNNQVTAYGGLDWRTIQRDRAGLTLNFILPEQWLSGTIQLQVEVNPDRVIQESNYQNNVFNDAPRTFSNIPALRIGYVPIEYRGVIPEEHIADAHQYLQQVYPLSQVDYFPIPLCLQAQASSSRENDILDNLKWIYQYYTLEGWPERDGKPDQLMGWVAHSTWGDEGGRAEGVGWIIDTPVLAWFRKGSVAFATDTFTNSTYQVIMAHEIGHNFGRRHPICDNKDPWWPYTNYFINDVGYNFNTHYPLVGKETEDFMVGGHCGAKEVYQWTSNYTFKKLYQEFAGLAVAKETQASMSNIILTANQPVLLISGHIYDDAKAQFTRVYQLTTTQVISQEIGTSYCLVLEANSSLQLHSSCFDISFIDNESGMTKSVASFVQVLPDNPLARRLVLYHGDAELAARVVSPQPPTVHIQTPTVGHMLNNEVDVIWIGNDADGDALTYAVSYSSDNGQSWYHLGVGITETHLLIDTQNLPGSSQAHLRVLASDGFHTARDTLVVNLPTHTPQATIFTPADGESPATGEPLLLRGKGYDAEDGTLPDVALTWSSDRDGILGTGSALTAPPLSPGAHTITLAATDRNANVGMTTVQMVVPNKVYFPVVIRNYPSHSVQLHTDLAAWPISGEPPLTVTFTNLSTGDYATSLWDFGDGQSSTQQEPTHSYTSGGIYSVTLTINRLGVTETLRRVELITVYESPRANFAAQPIRGQVPLTVTFTNLSEGYYTSSSWNFGDGQISIAQNPQHIYTMVGAFTVTLTVSGDRGLDTVTKVAYINVSQENHCGPAIGQWTTTTPLPQALGTPFLGAGRQFMIYNSYAYIFTNGYSGNAQPVRVYYSLVNTDGTLESWIETTAPSGKYYDHAVARVGNYFYLITGAASSTAVYYASINSDGTLDPWIGTTPLTPSRQNFAVTTYGDYVYASGGNSWGTSDFVKVTSANANGTLKTWADTTSLPYAMEGHVMIAHNGYLYVLPPDGHVYYAAINMDGTIGHWNKTMTMPQAVSRYSAAEHSGYLYLLGAGDLSVYHATILENGMLSQWQTTTALPERRDSLRVSGHNCFIYAVGGRETNVYQDTVYFAPLE